MNLSHMSEKELLVLFQSLCGELADRGIPDITYASRSMEVILADKLGHTATNVSDWYDAFDDAGNVYEYKARKLTERIEGFYSWKNYNSWEDTDEFLRTKKFGGCKYHYFVKYCPGLQIKEMWRIAGMDLYHGMIKKVKARWDRWAAGDPKVVEAAMPMHFQAGMRVIANYGGVKLL